MPESLYDKIWNEHLVHQQEDGTSLLFVDRHLIHEVTSPQAFEGLRNSNRKVRRAKLYYLRDRTGKSARIAEKIKKKIGIDVETKIHEVTEENVMPDTEQKTVDSQQDSNNDAPKVEAKKTEEKKETKEETPSVEKKTDEKKENPEVKK